MYGRIRIKNIVTALGILLLTAACSFCQDQNSEPAPIKFEELMKNPKNFVGKSVVVEGFLITNRFKNSVLYDTMENAYYCRVDTNPRCNTFILDCPLDLNHNSYPVHVKIYAKVHNETGVLHALTRIDLLPIDKKKATELSERGDRFQGGSPK